jgi:hypothetical protein
VAAGGSLREAAEGDHWAVVEQMKSEVVEGRASREVEEGREHLEEVVEVGGHLRWRVAPLSVDIGSKAHWIYFLYRDLMEIFPMMAANVKTNSRKMVGAEVDPRHIKIARQQEAEATFKKSP